MRRTTRIVQLRHWFEGLRCIECGYSLVGSVSPCCSECGAERPIVVDDARSWGEAANSEMVQAR